MERLQGVATLPPFEDVVARHGPTVLRVCRALLGPADAEDAWSETFLAALKAYPKLSPGSHLEAWLITIARRKALDQRRARRRRPLAVGELSNRPAPNPKERRDESLRAALQALPPRQREAVAYHYLTGLTYSEVAAVIGGSPEAARRAASDGIASLRKTTPKGDLR